jgi:hypothetical protein
MSFLENFKNMFGKKKSLDYRKIELRASLKDLMKMRGLRSINFANYHRWKNDNGNNESPWLHSLKLNLMDGYLYMYGYRNGTDPRAGQKIEDATAEMYGEAYSIVKRILDDEANIPSKVKRNILVKMAR